MKLTKMMNVGGNPYNSSKNIVLYLMGSSRYCVPGKHFILFFQSWLTWSCNYLQFAYTVGVIGILHGNQLLHMANRAINP